MKYTILILAMLVGLLTAKAEATGVSIYKNGYVKTTIGYKVYQKIKKAKKKAFIGIYNFQRYYLQKKAHEYRVLRKKVKKFINRKTRR